jgi:hypothetical protein
MDASNLKKLGAVIAEHQKKLYDQAGEVRQVIVRMGTPFRAPIDGMALNPLQPDALIIFRCPFQILGLGFGERIYAPVGGNAFECLQFAMDLIGDMLKGECSSLNLEPRPKHLREPPSDYWIWQYSD